MNLTVEWLHDIFFSFYHIWYSASTARQAADPIKMNLVICGQAWKSAPNKVVVDTVDRNIAEFFDELDRQGILFIRSWRFTTIAKNDSFVTWGGFTKLHQI
jgi:hypothetical protein